MKLICLPCGVWPLKYDQTIKESKFKFDVEYALLVKTDAHHLKPLFLKGLKVKELRVIC